MMSLTDSCWDIRFFGSSLRFSFVGFLASPVYLILASRSGGVWRRRREPVRPDGRKTRTVAEGFAGRAVQAGGEDTNGDKARHGTRGWMSPARSAFPYLSSAISLRPLSAAAF